MNSWIRRPLGQVLVAVAVALGAGGIIVTQTGGGGATPGTANLWVDTNGGTCTRQATPGAYVDAQACASFSAAYSASSPGDTVLVRAGSYGTQSTPVASRSGAPVVFDENGGDVTVGSMNISGDWAIFKNFTATGRVSIEGTTETNKAVGNRFEHMRMLAGAFLMDTDQTTIFGLQQCLVPGTGCHSTAEACCQSATSQKVIDLAGQLSDCAGLTSTCPDNTRNSNVLIDGVDIYDSVRTSSTDHKECVFFIAPLNGTIRNSRFWNCSIYGISVARIGSDRDPQNVVIENNTFEPSDDITVGGEQANSAIVLAHVTTRFNGLYIRNNSMAQNIEINTADVPDSTGYDQTFIESNIIHGLGSCTPSGTTSPTYRNNVLDGANCGTGATMVADVRNLWTTHTAGSGGSGYNGLTWNFHLVPGAAAIGAASSTSGQFTTTDQGGCTRDGDPDAGAIEFGGGC